MDDIIIEKPNGSEESFGDEQYFVLGEPLSSLFEFAEVFLEGAVRVVPGEYVEVIGRDRWSGSYLI